MGTKNFAIKFLVVFLMFNLPPAFSNPEGGHVSAGSATISSPAANTVQITQSSDKAIIDWHSFNIAPNERTQFQQPSANSVTLNRINLSQGVSQIYGQLSANGRIILVNPAGIYFGPTARVDVGGIIASTSDISNENFMAGRYIFDKPSLYGGTIINKGTIKAGDSGLVALMGASVKNDGLIVANLGTVFLASGNKFTLDFTGDQLINFSVDAPASTLGAGGNSVSNSGEIISNGGKVIMTARAVKDVLNGSINMSGVIVANSVSQENGVVILSAGDGTARVSGEIYASGKQPFEKGGQVQILGENVTIYKNAIIDVSGDIGGGEVLIGGDYQGKNPNILNADNTFVGKNVKIYADALHSGNGGKVIVWANNYTRFFGAISAKGGTTGGNGGFIETSGKNSLMVSGGRVNASAPMGLPGTWLLDPRNVIIDNAATTCTSVPCFSGGNPNVYTPDTNTSHVSVADILASLQAGTSVTITSGNTGAQTGTIAVNAAINKISGTTPVTLTLDSTNGGGTITVSNPITSTSGSLGVSLLSGNAITITDTITTNGGNFVANAQNAITLGNGAGTTPGVINVGAGLVSISANQDGAGAQNFTMNPNSTITTTDTTSNAVKINVNTSLGGTGTAVLRDITTGDGGTITVSTDTGGNITGGDITQPAGTLNAGNSGTITLTNPNVAGINIGTTAANINISAGILNLITGTSGGFVTNIGTGGLNLGNITTSGAFSLISTGSSAITDSGTLTISGTTTLAAGATQNITLNSIGNDFSTMVVTSANNVTLVDNNALNFGLSAVSGNLNVTVGGNLTDSAAISVANTATFSAGSNNITLDTATNNFNIVSITSANDVTLRDANAVVFGNASISGNLMLTTAGAITQDTGTAILVNGSGKTATFLAGSGNNITLDNTGNDFTSIVVSSGNNVTLRDVNSLQFGASTSTISGTLGVVTGGNLTQLGGALIVSGLATFNPGSSNNIILDNATNNFDTVKIVNANNATIRDTTALNMDTSLVADTLTLTADNGITQSGAITVPTLVATTRNNAGAVITLNNIGNSFNEINLRALNAAGTANAAGAITLVNAAGFDVSTIGTTSTINLSSTGIITDSGNMTGSTLTTSSVGGTVLDFGHNLTGFNATNTTSGNIQLINTGTLAIVSGISQSGGGSIDILNTGAITATGDINTNGGSGAVGVHATNALTLNGDINAGSGAITLDANTGGVSGNFTMNAGASMTTTNATANAVMINVNNASGGAGTAALRDITVGDGGTITVRTNTGNNTTGGDISQASGILNSGSTGTVTLINPNIVNNNIGTAALPINISAGTLNASSGNSGVFITNMSTSPLIVKTLEAFRSDTGATGSAQIISNGVVQQTGASNPINVATLTIKTLNDAGADISFNNSGNSATNINLSARNLADTADAAGIISYQDSSGINITGLGTSSDATIIANGVVTDSGTISVGGTLSVSSVGGMTLNNSNSINTFNGANTGGGNITFSGNTVPLSITGLTQSGGGTVSFTNPSDITIANGAVLNTGGGAATFTMTSGIFSMGINVAINSGNANIAINTMDINLDATSSINSGTANLTITQNTPGGSIGLGNAVGTLTLSGAELQRITANNLGLVAPTDGQIVVDGVTSINGGNISGTTTLTATAGTLGTITFQGNPSYFKALTANSDNGIMVGSNAPVTTTVGNLALNGDVGGGVGGSDNITLNSHLTAAGSLTLSAASGGIILNAPIHLTGNGITFNSVINGGQDLTLNAGSSGNITFNANVGNITRIGMLNIINVNNLINNALINASSYTQSAGNIVNLGTSGLNLTGNVSVIGTTFNGALNVSALTLNVGFARFCP